MFSRSQRWHARLPIPTPREALIFAAEYGQAVPRLVVCDVDDAIAVEMEAGTPRWPADLGRALSVVRGRIDALEAPATAAEAQVRCAALLRAVDQLARDHASQPGGHLPPDDYHHPLWVNERKALALAAAHDLALGRLGWEPVENRLATLSGDT
jgi:hypothetical protein